MSHLILATNDVAADTLRCSELANVVLGFCHRFVWGRLPSDKWLMLGSEPRSAKHSPSGDHWLDDVSPDWLKGFGTRDIGLLDLCEKFDSIEVWVDPRPNDQLVLVWLLELLRPYKEITTKLSLVPTDDAIARYHPQSVAKWQLPTYKVTDNHLALASRAWHAWRATTPERCFDLLMKDMTILPGLRRALIALLEELPDMVTGLGESEGIMLDFVEEAGTEPEEVLDGAAIREVFDKREAGKLLRGLLQCPAPAIFETGQAPLDTSEQAVPDRYGGGQIALTELGRAIRTCEDDFSRHNPIHRWWGGTELTNDRLWRWDSLSRSLVAP